ncbi:PWWP domain protein [Talaromyces stipitatus ATCC 10500]|uniref:PWWP domain protein n=1 Tax=Talaromyces stipitatus (strain ATCC 10500 / CBS 375.48 / QM 6759 / NRRL 1006) TaxID=441959 RepID=B8ME22_TALSN|nr:PWWP domain protein [Talaromyces stipitatus ATCC 10500]EED16099.1 PWWP domain protein [Talaromyces stipitatus ATCC 10500]
MSEESPATPAVAANAGDSRVAAGESKPDSATAEQAQKQDDGKTTETEEKDKPAEKQPENTEAAPAAEPTEVNGKDDGEPTLAEAPAVNGTSTPRPSSAKRKSVGGPSSSKKLNKKKSQQRITHLDAAPGEYYLARLKSFPPWPAIICDEEMLPLSLLNTRPVTTKQADGTYKEAYADGGKRVHDRTFPIMFLETNEFAWIPNTDLTPLDPAQCKDVSEKGKGKQLIAAYKVAAEGHDLQYFKNLLADHQRAIQQEAEEREAVAAEKAALKAQKEAAKEAREAAKEEKKKKRKSVAAETEDVEMADADEGEKKPKSTKKRKKDAGSDAEDEKPPKTPKTATKLKLSTPKDPNAEKPKTSKAKKPVEQPVEKVEEPPKERTPQIDPQEAKANKQKRVLFLRHKLQKGFLQRDQAPKEEEMDLMAKFMTELENYGEIEVSIIRKTKIQKVLKAIIKLPSIPKEEEYHFKQRSMDILTGWKNLLDSDIPTPAPPADKEAKPESNGANALRHEAASADEPKADGPEPKLIGAEPSEAADDVEDQSMADAAPEESKNKPEVTEQTAGKETATETAGDAKQAADEASA